MHDEHRAGAARSGEGDPRVETDRLVLRPWRTDEAALLRELWSERDPRVPAHRRIGADGRPTVEELQHRIRARPADPLGLRALERKGSHDVVGYCGLVDSARGAPGEPELAFELLRRAQGNGYATEAASAVLDEARRAGLRRIWATVWDWNSPSLRVLARVGSTRTGRTEPDDEHGTTLSLLREL